MLEDAPLNCRVIGDDDLTPVAEFLNMCWRVTYKGILDDGFLAGLTTENRVAILRDKMARGVRGCMVFGPDEALLAVLMYGPTHLHATANAGEISMIYVRPGHTGTGLGHRLMRVAEAALMEDGYSNVELDAFVANEGALRFYRDNGYVKVGAKQDHIEGHTYDLDIMAKALG